MQLYLLRKNELRMTILPGRVSGQYSVDYTADNGNVVPLVRVNARDDKWYIAENRFVQISGEKAVERGKYREFEIKENSLYFLNRDGCEIIILMAEPEAANRKRFRIFNVPAGGIIDVGQADYNQIIFKNQYVNESRHLRITYQDGLPCSVMNCDEEINTGRDNPSYLNGKRIDGVVPAHIGDVVFLFGMKIVLGKDFVAVNDPDNLSEIHMELKDLSFFVADDSEEDDEHEDKTCVFSSAPRARKEFIHRNFTIEKAPDGIPEDETPWIVMMGPSITMAMGSVFSSIMTLNNVLANSGSIVGALPSLVTSVIMVIGSAVWPSVGRRFTHRAQVRKAMIASEDYRKYLENVRHEIENAAALQAEILKENNPLLNECIDIIFNVHETLWQRSQKHKDFLDVMIGIGDVPLDADFSFPERGYHSQINIDAKAMYDLVACDHTVSNVPITLPFKGAGIVGVIGDRRKVIDFGKGLLIELTSMHNYEDLKIFFIYNEKEREEWNFVKWIPHLWNDERTVRYLANDPEEVKNLSEYIINLRSVQKASGSGEYRGPYYLIIAADKTLAERAQAIKELYQSSDDGNMTMIALYDERQYLPKACSYVIDLFHDSVPRKDTEQGYAATLADYNDITGKRIRCRSYISYNGNPEDIFIKMANIRLDSPVSSKQLPTVYTFMEMFGVGKPEHLDLARRWKENSAVKSLAVPIGVDSDGYFINLDIHEKAHGPHGVIAGMTGSGKSEFIISYIASMAINYSPEDIAFVLIDFKGGGMADIFKDLPHTAGLITNLDGNELKRSFLAIEHELEKRQKLFKEISEQKKISNIDIYKYQKLRKEDPLLKPLPHLVLISDEFAELKQQHGDFMGQLIRIARIGRSLGVHLILATQKPDGVVDDQIKSNIRFKICLKVQDKSDSQGMIDRPDATLITNPGRFYFQVGNDEVFEYGQSPFSGAAYEPMDQFRKNTCDYIDVLNEQGAVICRESVPGNPRQPGIPEKQIDAVVEFMSDVANQLQVHAEKLWLNPLPAPKDEKKIETVYGTEIKEYVLNPVVGMYDDLTSQKHLPLTIPFTVQGNAILYGAAGSGKLDFLNTMLVNLMRHHSNDEVRFYLCDYDSGSLAAFEDSTYTESFVGAGDRNDIELVLNKLIGELTERREKMRRFGGDYQNFIHTSGESLPNILLVIHNFQNLSDSDSEARPKIVQLAREGTKYGMFVILTGTSSNSVPYSMQPLFKNIYTLRQNSDDQYRDILGKTEGIVPDQFRGRGLVRANGTICEFQTDIVFEEADNTYEAIKRFCEEKDGIEHAVEYETAYEEQKNAVDELAYALNSIPVAKAEISGKPIYYDLTGSATSLIIYDDSHRKQYAQICSSIKKSITEDIQVMELSSDMKDLEKKIGKLWEIMRERGKIGVAANEKGEPVPVFQTVLVFVNEPISIIDTITEEARVKLVSLIIHLSVTYRMFFVVAEKQSEQMNLINGKYFGNTYQAKSGILLTHDANAHILFDDDISFRGTARAPYGHIIRNHESILGEIIGEVDAE